MAKYIVQAWSPRFGWEDLNSNTPGMGHTLEGMPPSFRTRKEAEHAIRMLRTFGPEWRDSDYRIVVSGIKGPKRKARLDTKGTAKPRSKIMGRFPEGNVIGPMMSAPGGYEYHGSKRDPKDPWAPAASVKKRMTSAQKKALAAYRFALQQEDRYLGSVFANAQGQKRYEALTQAAYQEAKRLGLGIEHGL